MGGETENTEAGAGLGTKPVLVGERVVLRPFTEADILAMGPILADPEVLRLTGSVHSTRDAESADPRLDAATRAWYEGLATRSDRLDLAVVDAAGGRCVGEVVLNDLDAENRSCNFRILLGPAGRNRGLGSEATALLLEHAFTNTALHRISLEVYDFNPRARRVYERAGFGLEGTARAALLFDGQFIDAHMLAILAADPRPGPAARS
ncbi:GNAT family N-acetyltransferase [Arthrobacter sp. AQ5-05]|uniref:GNAT family N-acetyltransferase n=1 Tax=Arthrobacter sp. AQ5-05 TaxID=2184581 RepID=UPI000DCDADFE|nr:GNAT family protein [Arthrobacter sp. AQ5-05]RAX48345.1 GNAT family N-acetyltransferase [Arthrobacter sp. AQ5-05]